MTRTGFGKDKIKNEYVSALIYKLQRKKRLESNEQSNANNASIEDTSTSLRLLVMWGPNNGHKISARALLIRHSNAITWNEDTLEKLHSMHLDLLRDNCVVRDTWLLDDATVLMTILKWKRGKDTFKIIITEGTREDDSMEPLWIPSSI
jgi:hypothetical protein